MEGNALALATVDQDGDPHCIAIGFCKVVSGDQILITDNYMVKIINNIKHNKKVALSVWNKNWEKECVGYEFIGFAEYYNMGKWYQRVKKISENKGEPCKGEIIIKIKKLNN